MPVLSLGDYTPIKNNEIITVLSINLVKDKKTHYKLTCKVKDIDNLNKFMIELKNLKFVDEVERVSNESAITKK